MIKMVIAKTFLATVTALAVAVKAVISVIDMIEKRQRKSTA
jgi:hypothetical protein